MHRLLLALGLLLAVSPAAAQAPPEPLQVGQTLRITMRSGPRYVVALDSLRTDTVVVRPQRPPGYVTLRFGYLAMAKLEIARGHRPRARTALRRGTVGLILGAALGGALAYAAQESAVCQEFPSCATPGRGALVAGSAGLLIGGLSGLLNPSEIWEPVDLRPTAAGRSPWPEVQFAMKFR